jgi:hypothetical protein
MAKKKRVKKPQDLTLAQLQQMVESKASEVSGLKARRADLQKELDNLDRLIQQTEGTGARRRGRGRPPGTARMGAPRKKVARKAKRTRAKNKKSAKAYAVEILKATPQGLPLDQLANKILESGYKSNSASFKNTLYQSLYNARKAGKTFNYNDKTGHWVLR